MQEPKYEIGSIVKLKEPSLIYQIIGVMLEEREYQYKCDNGFWYVDDMIEGIAVPAFKKGDKVIHKNKSKEGVFQVDDMIYDKEFHSWRYWFEDCFESTVEEFLKLYVKVEVGSIVKDCGVDGVVIQVRCDGSYIVLWSDGKVTVNSNDYVKENIISQKKLKESAVKQHLKNIFCAMTLKFVNWE